MRHRQHAFIVTAVTLAVAGCWFAAPAWAQVGTPRPGTPRPAPRVLSGQAPQGFQLNPAQQKRIDGILALWERQSSRVKTFRCEFQRVEYDPIFGPNDPRIPKTISRGQIRYVAPDRGLYEIGGSAIRHFAGLNQEGKPEYRDGKSEDFGEKWISDGLSIFEYRPAEKVLMQMKLPPDMQGKAISDGPLPFLFGASADKLKARYWFREYQPQRAKEDPIQLEAIPRTRQDAQDFSLVRVQLDTRKFLPDALELHLPHQGKGAAPRTLYKFEKLRVNDLRDNLQNLASAFVNPKTPDGWKKVVDDFNSPTPPVADPTQQAQPTPPAAPQATPARLGARPAKPQQR